jgi:hypothetical protein
MDLEIAMEAQHEQSQAGSPRNGVLTYLTFLEKIGYLRGIICSAPRQILSAELSCIAVQLVATSKSLATAPDEGADSESSDHPMGGSSYEVIQLEDRRRRSCAARGSRATPTCGCTCAATARSTRPPPRSPKPSSPGMKTAARCAFFCPFAGCKRNREHRSIQALKTARLLLFCPRIQ